MNLNQNFFRIFVSTIFGAYVCFLTSMVSGQVLRPALENTGSQARGTQTSGTDDRITAAFSTATSSLAALRENDFETFVNLTHEKFIEAEGGREQLIDLTRRAKEVLEGQVKNYDAKVRPPSRIIDAGATLFAIVPQTVFIELESDQQIDRNSYLLGISADAGRTWRFVDGAAGAARIRGLFPDFPANTRLPDELRR